MDEAAAKDPPERLVVHLDDFDDVSVPHGELLSREQVESGFHESGNERCWCRPVIIETADTRTAIEVFADYIATDVGEVLT
jgi:hypothetical protein